LIYNHDVECCEFVYVLFYLNEYENKLLEQSVKDLKMNFVFEKNNSEATEEKKETEPKKEKKKQKTKPKKDKK
jgi:hypothetical protein